jgi:phosphoribosyl 1,2-cyclic phosphodiesterase
MIEANHDRGMLKDSARPWSLKQRISGRQGHLSNEGAAELVADIAGGPLTHVFLAHLSVQCNSPELAVKTVRRALEKRGIGHVSVSVASCDQVSDLWTAG